MPNPTKNLTATGNNSTRVSTPCGAKTASTCRQTKTEILKLLDKERKKYQDARAARDNAVRGAAARHAEIAALMEDRDQWKRIFFGCVDSLLTALNAMHALNDVQNARLNSQSEINKTK